MSFPEISICSTVGLWLNPTMVKYEETIDKTSSRVDMLDYVSITGFNYFFYLLKVK